MAQVGLVAWSASGGGLAGEDGHLRRVPQNNDPEDRDPAGGGLRDTSQVGGTPDVSQSRSAYASRRANSMQLHPCAMKGPKVPNCLTASRGSGQGQGRESAAAFGSRAPPRGSAGATGPAAEAGAAGEVLAVVAACEGVAAGAPVPAAERAGVLDPAPSSAWHNWASSWERELPRAAVEAVGIGHEGAGCEGDGDGGEGCGEEGA